MKALRSFTVRPRLPEPLAGLDRLAQSLRWSWDPPTRQLFESVDPELWDETTHDPVGVLARVSRHRLDELATDDVFLARLRTALADLDAYLDGPRWFQRRQGSPLRSIAYFSPEFGIAEALPQYSGGLGVLAGDHLKAASDLGVPLVGVGLFYRHGYFRQSLTADGWQQERFPQLDPYAMALTLCEPRVEIDLAGELLQAQIWRADVGRTPLYLLDADIEENPEHLRLITDRLYGGDTEHRLRQEILLGVGGVRALRALGVDAQLFHTNEGHAGFLGLERIRELVGEGLTAPEALEASRASCIFTTHTPVPAGIDRFPRELIEKYFQADVERISLSMDRLMALGHRPGDAPDERFNMAVMGMRLAGRRNGVAKLHGEVSRAMFADLWQDVPEVEVPVGSITNGVHGRTWVSPEMDELLGRTLGPDWHEGGQVDWDELLQLDDATLWSTRGPARERLIEFVRSRLKASGLARGLSTSEVAWTAHALDPQALTVGFARRFATYKRASLLLSQPVRLRKLLLDEERPIQFVFSGKAHPADEQGKELIRHIVTFSHDPEIRHRFCFVEDYDMAVARSLLQGADVWLNNPRRPLEACGTSGMKVVLSGGLNCSILDGWWAECFDTDNGWAISSAEDVEEVERRDEIEANSLFELLEQHIVPAYYERVGQAAPAAWTRQVRQSLHTLLPFVTADRMVRDYVTELYEPAAGQTEHLAADDWAGAKELAGWSAQLVKEWHGVHIDTVDADDDAGDLGDARLVSAVVSLGKLSPDEIQVQLVHGIAGQNDELADWSILTMRPQAEDGSDHVRYVAELPLNQAGRVGFTVRVVPWHANLVSPVELGRIAWAG